MGGVNWTAPANGSSNTTTETLKDYITSGHEPLAGRQKKKKKGAPKKQEDEVDAEPEGVNGLEALLDEDAIERLTNGHDEHNEEHEDILHDEDGEPVERRARNNKMTPSEFSDVSDSMPVSVDQLTKGAKIPPPPTDPNRLRLMEWFEKPNNLTEFHCNHIIDHLLNHKYPDSESADPNWAAAVRQCIWRCVVRNNFFWVNPDTGEATGKPKPVHRPDGTFENDFSVFVMCAAERLDRIGRDVPSEEYVKDVEKQVRLFLSRAEKSFMPQLRHLAFILMWDEEHRRELKIEDLAARVKKTFGSTNMRSDGCEILVPKEGVAKKKKRGTTDPVEAADRVWEHAKKLP